MNQRKAGVVLNYTTQILNILSGLIYTPIMLRLLGTEEYGLYSLISSTVGMIALINIGFLGGYSYFYFKALNKSEEEVKKTNGMFLTVFLVISSLCLLIGFIMVVNAESLFANQEYILNDIFRVKLIMALMVVNIAVGFPSTVFTSNIGAHERYVFLKSIEMIIVIISIILNLLILFCGIKSLGLIIVTLTLSIIKLVVYSFYSIKKLKEKYSFKNLDFNLFKAMLAFSIFIFFNQLTNTLNSQIDKVVLGMFGTLEMVSIYTVGVTFNSYFFQVSVAVSSVFGPQINKIVLYSKANNCENEGNRDLTNLYIKISRLQFFIVMLVLTGFIACGKIFVELWAGSEYFLSYYIAVAIMLSSSVSFFQNIALTIQQAKNMHRLKALIYLGLSIFNAILSAFLIMKIGVFGAVFGTVIVNILGDWMFMNLNAHYRLGLDMKKYAKNILPLYIKILPVGVIGYILSQILLSSSWLNLAIFVFGYTLFYFLVVYRFAFNEYEKNIIKSILKKCKLIKKEKY